MSYFRFQSIFSDGVRTVLGGHDNTQLATNVRQSGSWIHVIVNYIGSYPSEGMRVYFNGVKQDDYRRFFAKDTNKHGDGTVRVGKLGDDFGSVIMDELMFFNEKLTEDQIQQLYQQGLP